MSLSSQVQSFVKRLLFAVFVLSSVVTGQQTTADGPGTVLRQCWTADLGAPAVQGMLTDGGLLFTATSDGKLRAYNLIDGKPAWTVEMGGSFVSNILPISSDIIVVSSNAGENKRSTIRSISKETGVTHWSVERAFADEYYLGASTPNEITAVSSSGLVSGISAADGAELWKAETAKVTATPSFIAGKVLIATARDKSFLIVRVSRGSVELTIASKWKATAIRVLANDNIVVGDERGNITSYDAEGDKDWVFKNGASISHIIDTDRGLLAASNDNFLYMLTEKRGGVIWKRRLSGRIALQPNLMNGFLYAVTYGDGRGYLLSLEKGVVVDQTNFGQKEFTPTGAAATRDGRIAVSLPSGIAVSALNACS